MTKPKNFIFSSDYLALAQSSSEQFEFNIEARTMNPYSAANDGMSKRMKTEPGAIDRFYVSLDGSTWNVSSTIEKIFENDTDLFMTMSLSRRSNNSLSLRIEYTNNTANSYTFPELTLYVRVASFKPPNVL